MGTNCYLSEKIDLRGENSKKGVFAFETLYKDELLIKSSPECAVCPETIMEFFPFLHYVRLFLFLHFLENLIY